MRILTLEEMELVAGGRGSGGHPAPKGKSAPKHKGSHSGGSSGCGSSNSSSSGGGCGTPPVL